MAFSDELASLKSAWSGVIAAVAAGPLALWSAGLQPPWPSGSTIVATTACAVAIWLTFSIKAMARKLAIFKAIGSVSLIGGLLLGAFYFSAFNRYVVSEEFGSEGSPRRVLVVIGDELRPGVDLGGKSSREMLMDNLWEADKVWTESSIRFANGALLGLFVGCFFCLTLGSTIVTVSRRR